MLAFVLPERLSHRFDPLSREFDHLTTLFPFSAVRLANRGFPQMEPNDFAITVPFGHIFPVLNLFAHRYHSPVVEIVPGPLPS